MFLAKITIANKNIDRSRKFDNRAKPTDYFYYCLNGDDILCIINDEWMASSDNNKKWFNKEISPYYNHEEKIFEFIKTKIREDFLKIFGCELNIVESEIIGFEDWLFGHGEDFESIRNCRFLAGLSMEKRANDFDAHFSIDIKRENNNSKDQVIEISKNISSDLIDEYNRIDDPRNTKIYSGVPVIYLVQAESDVDAFEIVNNLTRYLYLSNRALNKYVYKLESCDMSTYLSTYAGSTIYFEDVNFHVQSSNRIGRISNCLDISDVVRLVYMYNVNTQFIIRTITELETDTAYKELSKTGLKFTVIKEDKLNYDDSCKYLKDLLEMNNHPELYDKLLEYCSLFNKKQNKKVSRSELYGYFRGFIGNHLYNALYPSYKNINNFDRKEDINNDSGKEFLSGMIGLKDVKNTIRRIVSTEVFVKYMRTYHGSFTRDERPRNHMVFTGNPGTAKSTVAKYLADILCISSVIPTDKIICVGREDLVGQYVGWTAKQVADKIEEAKGGILFIDEAYSLIDDNYGQEAINTLVKAMDECHTTIIFAGYPNEMNEFIKCNPGMTSRIKYFVDFPDYTLDELIDILKFKTKNTDLILSKGAIEAATEIIKTAMLEDDFGNGRFVRNLLEKAIENHAVRIDGKLEDLSEKQLLTLTKSDFANVDMSKIKLNNRSIGF